MAASAFVNSLPALIRFKYDPIHRLVNDLKGAMSSQLHMSYMMSIFMYGVNYKPFGSGAHFTEKTDLLAAFLESESPDAWMNSSYFCFLFKLLFVNNVHVLNFVVDSKHQSGQ